MKAKRKTQCKVVQTGIRSPWAPAIIIIISMNTVHQDILYNYTKIQIHKMQYNNYSKIKQEQNK